MARSTARTHTEGTGDDAARTHAHPLHAGRPSVARTCEALAWGDTQSHATRSAKNCGCSVS